MTSDPLSPPQCVSVGAETHCRWLQTARTGPGPTHSPQKNVMTCVPSGIFSLPIEKKKKQSTQVFSDCPADQGTTGQGQRDSADTSECFFCCCCCCYGSARCWPAAWPRRRTGPGCSEADPSRCGRRWEPRSSRLPSEDASCCMRRPAAARLQGTDEPFVSCHIHSSGGGRGSRLFCLSR